MRNLLCGFVGILMATGAMAADVVDRQSCADIKSRIDTLAADTDLNDSDAALLADLRAAYRRDCMARASGRGARTIAATRTRVQDSNDSADAASVVVEPAPVSEEPVVAEKCNKPDSNGCCPGEDFEDMGADGKYCCRGDMCFPPMAVTPEKSEKESAAEIAANIEKGLCGDGTKPNKFGCCPGEIFKDLGNAEFACCRKDTNECFPPMN